MADQVLYGRKGYALSNAEVEGLKELGRIIRRARLDLGLSQRGLERRSLVDQTTISRLENGRLTHLSLQHVARLFQVLRGRVDLSYLRDP
jgi:transcriptional regulator with XRE-family HTH domain